MAKSFLLGLRSERIQFALVRAGCDTGLRDSNGLTGRDVARVQSSTAVLERLKELVALQERILEACTSVVSSGGCLVYSTCSLEPEENEDRISAFLERHPEFELESSSGVSESYVDERGQLYVLPQDSGFDGAFAARLRKRSGSERLERQG